MTDLVSGTRPRIAKGFRFQWEPAQNCHVLLYPEGMVKLNDSASEILRRCDGEHSVASIVNDIEQTHSLQGVEADVVAFLEMAVKKQWVAWA